MRAFLLPLFAVTLLATAALPNRASAQVEKAEEPKAEPAKKEDAGEAKEAAPKKEAVWKIRRVDFQPAGAQVMLEDKANRRLQNISKGDGPTRLLAVQHEAEKGELRVKALIDGKEVDITQPLAELEAGGTRSGPRPGGGPSEEDRRKYEALNDSQREKFRDKLREKFSAPAFRNLPEQERREQVRQLFEKVSEENTKEGGSPAAPGPKAFRAKKDRDPGAGGEEREEVHTLSQKAREKLHAIMLDKAADESFRNVPEEERRKAFRDIVEKIEKEDQEGR